jgi:hypothetical protein
VVEDQHGLKVSGRLNLDIVDGREMFSLIKQKAVDGLSIGFRVPAGGYQHIGGVRHIKEIELWEVSIVPIPANSAARITSTRSADEVTSRRDYEAFLHHVGFAKAAARKLAGGGWPAMQKSDDNAAAELLQAVKQATLKLKGSSQ